MADYMGHGLDTNVLLRYVLEDDEKQFARARRLIEDELTLRQPGRVHAVVLCELVWVLRSAYNVSKPDIVGVLRTILAIRTLHVLEESAVREAVEHFAETGADFAYALLFVLYRNQGASLTTFDRAASELPGCSRLV